MTGTHTGAATDPADPIKEPPAGGPSSTCRPVTETLEAGSVLWRVHRAWHIAPSGPDHVPDDGTVFNPGHGAPTRFGPFTSRTAPFKGRAVPLLYAGESDRSALFETVLHDQMPGSFVDHHQWTAHLLSAVEVTAELDLVSLHGTGLRSLGLYAGDITDTYPRLYPRCTRWAAWIHQHLPTAAGLTWRSRQDNSQRAYLFFGDRMPPGTLTIPDTIARGRSEPVPIGHGPGLDWVRGVAASIRVKTSM